MVYLLFYSWAVYFWASDFPSLGFCFLIQHGWAVHTGHLLATEEENLVAVQPISCPWFWKLGGLLESLHHLVHIRRLKKLESAVSWGYQPQQEGRHTGQQEAKAGRQTALSSLGLLYIWAVAGRSAPFGGRPSPSLNPSWKCFHRDMRDLPLILDPSKLAIKINPPTIPSLASWLWRK